MKHSHVAWGTVLSTSDERERASGLSLSQIETFLALVEEGSMPRASRRLGLGRSTLSAHIKSLGDEFNQRLFVRIHGGLAITPAGLEAYRQLRPLMARAGYCMAYFHDAYASTPPKIIKVAMPAGFSGALIDQAIGVVGKSVIGRSPATWVMPAYGTERDDGGALVLNFGGLKSTVSAGQSSTRISDRWIVVRSSPNVGWSNEPVRLSDLADLTITVPKLPDAQLSLLLAVAEKAQARINFTSLELHEIFAEATLNQNFCFMMPAALLNPSLASQQFECAVLERSELDPGIGINGSDGEQIGAALAVQFSEMVDGLLAGAGLIEAPEPERLSLKYCRSFLALFEERNVRRAAQRLCIVQPALTVQLHGLEDLLGTPLFVRSHRGLQPNERAEALNSLLAPLMAQFSAVSRSLRAPLGGRSRRLRLGLIPALDAESETAEYFADALDRWSGKHPEIVVQVLEAYSGKLLQWLSSGRIDFALIDRIVPNPDMVFELIAEDRMAVVVDRAADMLQPGPVTLENVAKLPLVLPSSRHGLRSILLPQLRKAGLDLSPRIEVDSMAAAISLVKMGRYATILPVGAIYKSRDRRRLSIHEICEPQILRSICLAQLKNELSDGAAQDFIAELRLAFSHAGEFNDETADRADEDLAQRVRTTNLLSTASH